ncbi:MAG: hypothetical protein IJI14_05430 [Anaerolineaceae bacterium]|nr:hypothetical protein [Anaerolineaceae bacterium]
MLKTHNLILLVLVCFFITILNCSPAFADEGGDGINDINTGPAAAGQISVIAADAGTFDSFAQLCFAAKCVEDCSEDEKRRYSSLSELAMVWNRAHPDNRVIINNAGDIAKICEQANNPPDFKAAQEIFEANGGSHYSSLTSGCPCPEGIEIKKNGCSITFVCKIGGDTNAELTATTPCPQVRGTDPKYPLVKMLSGTLIEWNGYGTVTEPMTISFGAPGGISSPGAYFGAEYYQANYTVTLSSIDIGQNRIFDENVADKMKGRKHPLDRSNFVFQLVGGNEYVKVLDQHDIYNAYKNKGPEVQAYLALANKGWGERPWTTYEEFVKGMCKMSSSPRRCTRELGYKSHKDYGMQGNLYLGNGDMSILGLYSEVSSHGCHGATVVNDKGEPAFAVNIESTWCFYVHAEYQGFTWQIVESKYIGQCCDDWQWVKVGEEEVCSEKVGGGSTDEDCEFHDVMSWECQHYQEKYTNKYGWESIGGTSVSTGDCGVCGSAIGYIDEKGKSTTKPLGVSFYQSQPLLLSRE